MIASFTTIRPARAGCRGSFVAFRVDCRQPGHYTRFGVTSGWAVTRPEHGQLGFLRLDWLVNERMAIYHSSRKVVTSQLAKITCPRSRLYRNLDPWRRTSYWSDFQDIINRDAKPGPSAGQKMCGVSQS
jgi:hypothetical protein